MVMGRPFIEIDRENFEKLCVLQCTLGEIADFFDCCEDVIESWCKREYQETFRNVYKRYSGKGKISLRRKQWKLAEKSVPMAIFLGKNYLGQSDHQYMKLGGDSKNPIEVRTGYDLSKLNEEELQTLRMILQKANEESIITNDS